MSTLPGAYEGRPYRQREYCQRCCRARRHGGCSTDHANAASISTNVWLRSANLLRQLRPAHACAHKGRRAERLQPHAGLRIVAENRALEILDGSPLPVGRKRLELLG